MSRKRIARVGQSLRLFSLLAVLVFTAHPSFAEIDQSSVRKIPHIDEYESLLIWVWDEMGPRLEFRRDNPRAKQVSEPLPLFENLNESG